MKKNFRFSLFLVLSLLLGVFCKICYEHLKKTDPVPNNEYRAAKCELEMYYQYTEPKPHCSPFEDIVIKGSTDCYDSLRCYYSKIGFYKYLQLALLMANKFDYTQAYYDVYYSLYDLNSLGESVKTNNWSLEKLDKKTQKLAIDYLKTAANKGHKQAKEILAFYAKEGKYLNE